KSGDRIVEIGAIELMNHMPTGAIYHQYINPERAMPADAFAVHGLGDEFLRDKPVFKNIASDFIEFIGDSKLIIHNASFDMKFLNAELDWVGRSKLPMDQAIDTLEIARRKFPGAQNSLDALCRRFTVDNSSREKHGALLDSELLAEVYLELIGGRQPDLVLSNNLQSSGANQSNDDAWKPGARPTKLPPRLTEQELGRHKDFVSNLGEDALWPKFNQSD
ncbi:MAG: DNA polymerase-3 subunit epsilon, partial [Paracoccaceae bacterium]